MSTCKRNALGGFLLALAATIVSTPAVAESTGPDKPAWRCLPGNTVAAAWLTNLQRIGDQLNERTRLGELLLSGDFGSKFQRLLREEGGDEWSEFKEELKRYGLEPGDGKTLLLNGTGVSLVIAPRPDRAPVLTMLAWANPGEALGKRLMSAARKASAEMTEQNPHVRRYDIEVAGREVMHLSEPSMASEQGKDNGETESFVADRTNWMLTRLGGRLIVAATLPQSESTVKAMSPSEREDIDWRALTGMEQATGVLARFIQAHEGSDGAFLKQMRATPGLTRALPSGSPVWEGYFNLPALTRVGKAYAQRAGMEDAAETLRAFRQLGLSDLGPIALRTSLEETTLRTGLFVSSQTPRKGVLKLLDQPSEPPQVPDWVTSQVLGYTHFSADLRAIYNQVKQLVIDQVGQSADQMYSQIERSVRAQTQTPLTEILSSLGSKHAIVTFETRMVDVEQIDTEAMDPDNPPRSRADMPKKTVKMPQNRMAWVWALDDPPVWKTLFDVAGRFAPQVPFLKKASEQGFNGWRVENEQMPMGLFRGKGYLTLTLGGDVNSRVLAMLRTPPEGQQALKNTRRVARARDLMPPRPGMLYAVQDYGRQLKNVRRVVTRSLQMGLASGDAQAQRVQRWVKELVPSADQFEEVVGVSAAQAYTTDNGLIGESIVDLPKRD